MVQFGWRRASSLGATAAAPSARRRGRQRPDWRADRIAIGHAVRVVAPDFGRVEPVYGPRVPRWWLVLVAVLCSPIVLVYAAKGADNWCDSQLFAASPSGYSGKHMSPSVWPPGVRCSADIDNGRFEAWWPINW